MGEEHELKGLGSLGKNTPFYRRGKIQPFFLKVRTVGKAPTAYILPQCKSFVTYAQGGGEKNNYITKLQGGGSFLIKDPSTAPSMYMFIV